jgi:hypothetical protein
MTGTPTYVNAQDTVSLLIKVETTPGSGTFSSHALINTQRSLKLTSSATASEITRTDDPTQPAKTVRTVVSTDSSISGEGTLDLSDQIFWANWVASGAAYNVQAIDAASGGMEVAGPYVCTSFEKTGSKHGEKITASITLEQADQIAITTTNAVTPY